MKVSMKALALSAALLLPLTAARADEPNPYTDGPITVVTYVKILPGGFDAYMKFLATTRKAEMDEQMKAGLILNTHVYQAQARGPHEADMILTVTYKNWAAFDGLSDKQDAISKKLMGSLDKATAASVDRGKIREILGSETIQELILK